MTSTPTASAGLARFDPGDPALSSNPYPTYASYRELDPVHWGTSSMTGLDGSWYLFRHRDNAAVLTDAATYASDPATVGRAIEVPEAFRPVARIHQRWLGGIDPPDHTRLRSLMVRAFTPRRVAGLQPRVDYITGKLLDDALARGEGKIDIIADLSFPLPMSVIGDALGVDEADWGLFRGWAEDVSDAIDRAGDPAAGAAGSAAIEEMFDYFQRLIRLRRHEPSDDLLSAMVAAVDSEGQPMQEFDAIAIAVELGFAGHETTMYSVAIGVLGLMEQRDRWDQLVAAGDADELWDPAVDELLRWTTPVQRQRWRWATQDTSIDDREIRRGDPVVSLLGAANRDPEVFPDPDRIDFARPQARHLTFGFGSHFCLGSALARSELRTALRLLSARVPAMTLADPDGVAWRDNSITPGPLAVWVDV
jgi:cytochrome P450